MIFGQDFKYCIPEMDRLLGALADIGFHFSYGNETISDSEGRKHLIQLVNEKINDTFFQIMVSTHDANKREEEVA